MIIDTISHCHTNIRYFACKRWFAVFYVSNECRRWIVKIQIWGCPYFHSSCIRIKITLDIVNNIIIIQISSKQSMNFSTWSIVGLCINCQTSKSSSNFIDFNTLHFELALSWVCRSIIIFIWINSYKVKLFACFRF